MREESEEKKNFEHLTNEQLEELAREQAKQKTPGCTKKEINRRVKENLALELENAGLGREAICRLLDLE